MKSSKTKNRKTPKKHKKTQKFQKLNCSPLVHNKTPVRDSCFTDSVLQSLKISFNKHHPDNSIQSTDSNDIWNELRTKMNTCSKEDCWLQELTDSNVRTQLQKQLFAPYHPKEWNKKPNAWLSNFDILDVLKQYEDAYPNFKIVGPTPIDFDSKPKDMGGNCVWDDLCKFDIQQFIKNGKTKIGVVFNLDKHDEDGSHWVSLFIDLDDRFIFYLDSAGEPIQPEIKQFVKRITSQAKSIQRSLRFFQNAPVEHQMQNNECGMYSIYFIVTMLTSKTDGKTFAHFMEKVKFFKNHRIPDKYINGYRKLYFNS